MGKIILLTFNHNPKPEINYFSIFFSMRHWYADLQLRQNEFIDAYMKKCDCLACVKNYPTINMQDISNSDFINPDLHLALVKKYDFNAIKKLIPKYCEFLNTRSTEIDSINRTFVAEKILSELWSVLYLDKLILPAQQSLIE